MVKLAKRANIEGNNETFDDSFFEALEPGIYKFKVIDSKREQNKSGVGEHTTFIYEVIEGSFKGKKVFENLNLDHPNKTADDIANKKLNALCLACNKYGIQYTEELHGCIFSAETDQSSYNDRKTSRIKKYIPVELANTSFENEDKEWFDNTETEKETEEELIQF